MKNHTDTQSLNRIEKRAIEAQAVAPIIKAIADRIGQEDAFAILVDANQQEAFQRGRQLASEIGENGIEALAAEVAGWGRGGDWGMDVLEQTATTFFFNVTRCPYFEKYRELGLEALGVGFSCCRDEPFARGFNPRMRLVRTQTIMEGAPYCDFRYHLEEAE